MPAAKSPGMDKESNWLPVLEAIRSRLYIRAYWADKAILDGTRQPPKVEMIGSEGALAAAAAGDRRSSRASSGNHRHRARGRRGLLRRGTDHPEGVGERLYVTPPLTVAKAYHYTHILHARWQDKGKAIEQTREGRGEWRAKARVDFTRPALGGSGETKTEPHGE